MTPSQILKALDRKVIHAKHDAINCSITDMEKNFQAFIQWKNAYEKMTEFFMTNYIEEKNQIIND